MLILIKLHRNTNEIILSWAKININLFNANYKLICFSFFLVSGWKEPIAGNKCLAEIG